MSFLNKLFRRKSPAQGDSSGADSAINESPATIPQPEQNDCEVIADDPSRFSEWIFENLVQTMTDEDARSFCATPEEAERLQITDSEQVAAANEFVLMFALGACMFTGLNFSRDDHGKFKAELAVKVSKRLFGGHIDSRIEELQQALDSYLEVAIDLSARDKLFSSFSERYFDRVYPNNPNSFSMHLNASIASFALDLALEGFKITQDAYFNLKYGMPYKSWLALNEALEGDENPMK